MPTESQFQNVLFLLSAKLKPKRNKKKLTTEATINTLSIQFKGKQG